MFYGTYHIVKFITSRNICKSHDFALKGIICEFGLLYPQQESHRRYMDQIMYISFNAFEITNFAKLKD